MNPSNDCFRPEPIEFVESGKGFWDGRGWVTDRDVAIEYPAGTLRAQAARRIIEEQTGRRCWVALLQPEEASH